MPHEVHGAGRDHCSSTSTFFNHLSLHLSLKAQTWRSNNTFRPSHVIRAKEVAKSDDATVIRFDAFLFNHNLWSRLTILGHVEKMSTFIWVGPTWTGISGFDVSEEICVVIIIYVWPLGESKTSNVTQRGCKYPAWQLAGPSLTSFKVVLASARLFSFNWIPFFYFNAILNLTLQINH